MANTDYMEKLYGEFRKSGLNLSDFLKNKKLFCGYSEINHAFWEISSKRKDRPITITQTASKYSSEYMRKKYSDFRKSGMGVWAFVRSIKKTKDYGRFYWGFRKLGLKATKKRRKKKDIFKFTTRGISPIRKKAGKEIKKTPGSRIVKMNLYEYRQWRYWKSKYGSGRKRYV